MKYYNMKIAGCDRSLPLCPINDTLYIGAFIILGDPELSANSAKELLKKVPEYDYLITAECKGIPLAHDMASIHGDKKYFVARKSKKLYMSNIFETTVNSITTAKSQTLYLDGEDAKLINGKRILIVDDVISTGESIAAVEKLIENAGGTVVCKAAILAEGDAADREDIVYLEKLPLFDKDGNPL